MAVRELEIIVKLRDEMSKSLSGVTSQLDKMQPAFKGMAAVGSAGFAALGYAAKQAFDAAKEQELMQAKLAHVLKTATKATDDQVQSLFRQANALEKVGVVNGEAILQAQQTLATFDLTAESVENLIPSFLDMVVAEKGVNASTEEMIGYANALGMALQGNYAALTKRGFKLDDDTKKLIENGTQQERVAAIVSVLDSTYEGLNESLRKTTDGGLKGLSFALDDIQKNIGNALIPMLQQVITWLQPVIAWVTKFTEENPKLAATILLVTAGLLALVAVIGIIGLALPAIIAGFTLLFATLAAVAPVLGIIALFGLIATALKDQIAALLGVEVTWKEVWTELKTWFTELTDWLGGKIFAITQKIQDLKDMLASIPSAVKGAFSMAATAIPTSLIPGAGAIGNLFKAIPFADGGIVTKPTLGLVGEAGPEAIIPLDRARGMGGGGVTVNVYGDVTGQQVVEFVKDALMGQMRLDGRLSL